MLKSGADVRARDRMGRTALHAAAEANALPAVLQLLAAGAELDARDVRGNTPLALAIAKANVGVADRLIKAGAELDASKSLLAACRGGHASLARLFLGANADPNAREGADSALLLAAKAGNAQLERELLAAGASADEAYARFRESRRARPRDEQAWRAPAPPTFSKQCQKCHRSFGFNEAQIEPLTRVEKMICEKEGLPFALMVKVTCIHCHTPSLVERSKLQRE